MRKELLVNPDFRQIFEEYQGMLHLLCRRFNRSVDELDIIKWLKNFEPVEWEDALTVLNNVEYIDDVQIIEAYNYCLEKILTELPIKTIIKIPKGRKFKKIKKPTKIVVVPIGMAGKSSSAMLYFLRKSQAYANSSGRILIISDWNEIKEQQDEEFSERYNYVFIDDYFGSGNSAFTHYTKEVEPVLKGAKTYWMSVVIQYEAEQFMTTKIPNCKLISWRSRDGVFLRDHSPFGSYKRMKYYREFCYRHGKKLDASGPLGYENTQGMVTFSYGSPNNLLPIFWSSKSGWSPLFPRYSKDSMARSKEFRKETAYWLSLARTLDLKMYKEIATGNGNSNSSKQLNYITKIDFQLFAVIRMLKQKKSPPSICQILGISSQDFNEVLKEGMDRNLINDKGKLTEFGELAYNEVSREILEQKILESKPIIESSNRVYVPQSFRGLT